jgi:hypothetical protein
MSWFPRKSWFAACASRRAGEQPMPADLDCHPRRTIRGSCGVAHGVLMNAPAEQHDGHPVRTVYQLKLAGPVPSDLVRDLAGLTMSVEPAETVLYGDVRDQSALFALLVRIYDLGLQVLEVRRLSDQDGDSTE